jgi:acyl-CoA thioesterase
VDELQTAQRCAEKMMANDRAVRDDMVNGLDVIHGGLTFTLADTAFAFACNGYDNQSIAASAQVEFLRPAVAGDVLTALAKEDHRGRRNGYYTVTVRNQRDEVVALFRGRSVANGESLLK